MLDIATIKSAASGRWPEIICRITGIEQELLDGGHHPCPKCGGRDRFRMIDENAGALFCNACFSKQNGDGIAAIMWLTGLSFPEAAGKVCDYLGLDGVRVESSVIDEMAWRKCISADALVDYGASIADRNGVTVCRVPMYDADMNRVGDFDMSPATPELEKGKTVKGSRLGLFVYTPPVAGDTVVLVEGVKDACALSRIGYKAIGLPTCRMDATFARMFRGCHVVVVPDRDKAGLDGAAVTAANLFGVAASVKIAELPTEYKESGGADVRDVLRNRDGEKKVRDAIANAALWGRPAAARELKLTLLPDAVINVIESAGEEENLLKVGLPGVDDSIGGVLPGEMLIIAGRPSHGKTVVGMQAIDSLAESVASLIISEEMSIPALARRCLCGITEVSSETWKESRDAIWQQASNYYAKRHPIFIVEGCGTADRAIEAIAKAKQEQSVGAVMVDYVQLLRGKGDGRYEQVSDVSLRLKQAAMQYNVAMLALCQLNRQVEARQTFKNKGGQQSTSCPRMSDLRDSGQLEQDADIIIFVEWLHRTSPEAHRKEEYRLLIGKCRNRPIKQSIIDCVFKPERQRLYPLERRFEQPSYVGKDAASQSRYAEFNAFA
jgi:KaiC/GvpD/RAD55 family RecA-like ATPase